jgi:3'-5' exoribonuclease
LTFKHGDSVNQPFFVKAVQVRTYKNSEQRKYVELVMFAQSGESIPGRIWDWQEKIKMYEREIQQGDVIHITGEASEYQKQIQIRVDHLEWRDEDKATWVDQLLPRPKQSADRLKQRLHGMISSMEHPILRALAEAVLSDREISERLYSYPAAKTNHHATLHGLLHHIVSMMECANKVQQQYPFLNRDLLLAGVLYHDLGKIGELTHLRDGGDYTLEGKLHGHIHFSATLLQRFGQQQGVVKTEAFKLLQHMVLSHHGKLEWGSPVTPKIPEAVVLHMIDKLDAMMFCMFSEMQPLQPGEWVKRTKSLENDMLKHSLLNETEDYFS